MLLDRAELRSWMLQYLSTLLRVPEHDLDLNQGLINFGLDSADAIMMSGELEDRFKIELEPTVFLEVDTVQHLIDRLSTPVVHAPAP